MEKPEIQIQIDVPARGDIVVTARRNQVPVQGHLGSVVVAVCEARLPPGRFLVTAGTTVGNIVEIVACDARLVEFARARLERIAIDVEKLSLRPFIS